MHLSGFESIRSHSRRRVADELSVRSCLLGVALVVSRPQASLPRIIVATPEALPQTQAQRDALDRRLAAFAVAPSEGKTWHQVVRDLKLRPGP